MNPTGLNTYHSADGGTNRTLTRLFVVVDLAGGVLLLFLIFSCATFQFGPSLRALVWRIGWRLDKVPAIRRQNAVAILPSALDLGCNGPNDATLGCARANHHHSIQQGVNAAHPALKRCAAWYNFCIGWLAYSLSFAILTFAGQQDQWQPSIGVCRVQAAMVCASVAL